MGDVRDIGRQPEVTPWREIARRIDRCALDVAVVAGQIACHLERRPMPPPPERVIDIRRARRG